MALRVVGAGVGRTGTNSLQEALQRLLGGPCYHMSEVFSHPDHVPVWHAAVRGEAPDWDALFDGYAAAVDWPASACWRELAGAYPDAVVLLSTRDSAEQWWASYNRTIAAVMRRGAPPDGELAEWFAMVSAVLAEFGNERDGAIAAYERHNAAVRAGVPAARLVEWRPSDGWGPLCDALGVPVPDEPFPVTNSTDDFRAMTGLTD